MSMWDKIRIFLGGCDHQWEERGWSFVECQKCLKSKSDEKLNAHLRSEFFKRVAKNPNAPDWIHTFIKK